MKETNKQRKQERKKKEKKERTKRDNNTESFERVKVNNIDYRILDCKQFEFFFPMK